MGARRHRALLAAAASRSRRRPSSRWSTRCSSCPRGRASRCWRRSCASRRATSPTVLAKLRQDGFVRANIDGELAELAEPPKLAKDKTHTIEVFVDRLVQEGRHPPAADRLDRAGGQAGRGHRQDLAARGRRPAVLREVRLHRPAASATRRSRRACSRSTTRRAPARPATASAPRCSSTPTSSSPTRSCRCKEGAIEPWERRNNVFFHQILDAVCARFEIDQYVPWGKLPEKRRKLILRRLGAAKRSSSSFEKNGRTHTYKKEFEGVVANLERRLRGVRAAAARAGAHHRRGLRGDLRRVPPLHVADRRARSATARGCARRRASSRSAARASPR